MNKDELKSQAFRERVGQLVASYEDQLADFRADATIQLQELRQENERLKNELEEEKAKTAK